MERGLGNIGHRRIWVISGLVRSRQGGGGRGAEAIMRDKGIVWCSAVVCRMQVK